jgi:hypothetical protein
MEYLAVLNMGDIPKKIVLPLEFAGEKSAVVVRDLWNMTLLKGLVNIYEIKLPPHGAGMFSVTKQTTSGG